MANAELLKLVQSLSEHLVYTESTNVETNRKLWNRYAQDWTQDAEFVTKMVGNLPGKFPGLIPFDTCKDSQRLQNTFIFLETNGVTTTA